jgi:hypothetical protein
MKDVLSVVRGEDLGQGEGLLLARLLPALFGDFAGALANVPSAADLRETGLLASHIPSRTRKYRRSPGAPITMANHELVFSFSPYSRKKTNLVPVEIGGVKVHQGPKSLSSKTTM